ncbi:MAG TPA: peptidase M50 [Verrucomicrobiae bacterium]
MADAPATFSESWYRIAHQRIWLRPGVRVRRQYYRGERWMVLENPFSNEFFRIRPAAYEFIARLDSRHTVQQAWQECLDRFPDEAPGQEAVIQLLSQLYHANLLQYENAADSAQLFARYKKRREREVRSRLLNLMFMRFPLLDPDRFLVRTLPLIGKFIGAFGALLWLAAAACGIKVAIENFSALREQSQSVLAADNLFLLYLGMVVIKTLHEFGHAYFCRKFAGEVHVMGVLLMIFTPMPYVDATSSWSFRSRWQRVLVGAAGMIVELFVAALMVFVWANTGPGTLHNLAYNMIFVASVSTLVFNLNPLLRFDGYYILSDLVEIPNLQQRANRQLRHWCERYLFGIKKSSSPTERNQEAFWLVVFGIASGIYRVFVFGGILLVLADRFFLLGMVMAAVCAVSWVVVPAWKFVHYLAASPQLERTRGRAVAVSAAGLAVLLLLLGIVKFPSHFRAPGVLLAKERTQVVTETAGYVRSLVAKPGSRVTAGEPLLELDNAELELELAGARAAVNELDARLRLATSGRGADLKPLAMRLQSLNSRVQKLEADKSNLVIKARHDGIWVAPGLTDQVGRWTARGTRIGLLVNPTAFEFTAIVQQEDGDALFGRNISGAEVRLYGQVGRRVAIDRWRVIPAEQQKLPSPALGWMGGGEVPVSPDDPAKAAEPFFELHADVRSSPDAAILHGRSGKIRFDLEPEPLLPRWIRQLRQLLQKRYQL